MAFQLLDLSDLITFQLKRVNFDKLQFKDELHLQRQLIDLDLVRCQRQQQQQQQQQNSKTEDYLTLNKTPHLHGKSSIHYGMAARTQQSCPAELSQVASDRVTTRASKSSPLFKDMTSLNTSRTLSNVAFDQPRSLHQSVLSHESNPNDSRISEQLTKDFKSLVLDWFQQLRLRTEDFKSDDESKRMREAGNDSYRKDQHSLKACDFYTEAIFLAPAQNSIAAAMAHANRSTVLHDCGMYQQSYDDCLCALDLGYPEEYHALIKLRQASCALKLRNFSLCEQHLHELLHLDLSDALETRTHELWHQCELRKTEKMEISVQTDSDLIAKHNSLRFNETIFYEKLLPTESRSIGNASCIKSAKFIACNAVLFQEEAAAFAPSGHVRICDHCGVTQFVPFPCVFCSNRSAVYCSRKCRAAHAGIHAVECYAHQIELFEEFGREFYKPRLLQLAFRMLVNGLPQAAPYCRKKSTVNKLWNSFNSNASERISASATNGSAAPSASYFALIQLESFLDKESLQEKKQLASWAIVAQILAIYLAEYTDFFELIELTMPSAAKLMQHEWELLASSLLLRHICQLRHKHLVHCLSFALPIDPHLLSPREEYKLWSYVRRVQCGHLHLLAGEVVPVAYAVFPQTLSQCQHACTDFLYLKTNGTRLTAYATSEVVPNVVIKNTFISGNFRQLPFEARQKMLSMRGLTCQDDKCCAGQLNEDFQKFHRYRCDNPNCTEVFVPINAKRNSNNWWNSFQTQDIFQFDGGRLSNSKIPLLICNSCEQPQKLDWLQTFVEVLNDCDCEILEERCKLYAAVDRADTQLLDMNVFKVSLARKLLEQCLLVYRENPKTLEDWELNKLGSVMRSALQIVSAQFRVCSIQYVQHMSFLWDVMALGSYKCSDGELMQMLQALDFIPDEYKVIFINYYEDFIAPKYLEDTYSRTTDSDFK